MELKNRIKEKLSQNNYFEEMPFPSKNLLIEVTNYCNNKCIFCYHDCMKRKKEHIDEKMCRRILKEAYDLGTKEVGFYVAGEPLLNPKLNEYIKFAKQLGYKYIYITTNGILANLDNVKKLYDSGLNSIKYSINATNKEEYIKIHKTDNFDKVINNLKEVYNWKMNNSINLKVYVSYIATKYTDDVNKINDLFNNICDEYVVMRAVNQGGLIPNIKEEISTNNENIVNNNFSLPCSYPFKTIVVTKEGYLTACCMDFENLLAYADLNKCSIKESWNNEKIKKLREKHLKGNVKNTICESCIYNKKVKIEPLSKELCKINIDEIYCKSLRS